MNLVDEKLARPKGLPAFLQRKIRFVESVGDDRTTVNRVGYAGKPEKGADAVHSSASTDINAFKEPSRCLFDAGQVAKSMAWPRVYQVGPGLNNLGNTCFLNSVLQCLSYTTPFTNLLLARVHGQRCRTEGFCILCEMERLASSFFTSQRNRSISPNGIVANMKIIGKQFKLGRQEDAHEFLRYLIEAMQKICLLGQDPKLEARVKETSMIHAVFGGYLQSKVTCHGCKHESCVYDPLLDLSLEVRNASSVEQALKQFTATELLTRTNRYRCDGCRSLCEASKRFQVYRAPQILTIHLKRFQMLPMGMVKIGRDIEFPADLNLGPYMSAPGDAQYSLYAVLVHEGQSCSSGHYHCFVKASNGVWYSMNDQSVHQVSLATVLKQKAYILFYQKETAKCQLSEEEPVKERDAKRLKTDSKAASKPAAPVKEPVKKVVEAPPKAAVASPKKETPEEEPTLDVDLIVSKSMWHLSVASSRPSAPYRSLSDWSVRPLARK